MSLNDPLAAVLSNIMNYERNGKKEVIVKHQSKIIKTVLDLLQAHRYIGETEKLEAGARSLLKIHLLGNINKIGAIKPRFPVAKDNFTKFEKRYLPARHFGLLLVSTSQGIMTHEEAKEKGVGGKLLCYCY